MRLGKRLEAFMLLMCGVGGLAQTGPIATKSDAEISKEYQQAQALFDRQDLLGAQPLFEDLHQQRPGNNVFTERLALTWLAKAGSEAPADATATRE